MASTRIPRALLPALLLLPVACEPLPLDEPLAEEARAVRRLAEVAPAADSSLRRWVANLNHGSDVRLHVGRNVINWDRSLVRFDSAAVAQAVGGASLRSARLRLTIEAMDPLYRQNTPLALHPVTQAWSEAGVTWSCPDDPTPTDVIADCRPAPWDILGTASPPWGAAVASVALRRGQTGVVELDVTAEVNRWLARPGDNHGVLLRLGGDPVDAWVNFRSRETGAGPKLVLDLEDPYTTCTAGGVDELVADLDTYVDRAAGKAAFGTATTLSVAAGQKIALVAFSPAKLKTLAARKDAAVEKIELVLPVSGSGSGGLAAHLLTRDFVEARATWECASDSNTSATASTCAAADVWSFAGAPPYQPVAAASLSGALSGELRLDVTAAVDAAPAAPLLGFALLGGSVTLSSREGSKKPRLVVRTRETCRRSGAGQVLDSLSALPARDRAVTSLLHFGAKALACRVAQGKLDTPEEKQLHALIKAAYPTTAGLRDALAFLGSRCSDATWISATDRARLLGPLAAADPLRLPLASFGRRKLNDTLLAGKLLVPPRLRSEQCVGGHAAIPREVTIGVRSAPEFTPDDFDTEYEPAGLPAIVGIAPRHEDPADTRTPLVGHPAMIADYLRDRSDGSGEHIGDGMNPWGTRTTLACSNTQPCPGGLGLRCDGSRCVAYPIVKQDDVIGLIGFNFWDTQEAMLTWERVDSTWTKSVPLAAMMNRESEGSEACQPGSGWAPFERLYTKRPAERNSSYNLAEYPVDVEAGHFYRLRVFNRNGNYHTVHTDDPASGQNPARTVHVCWQRCFDDPNADPASCPRVCTGPDDRDCAVTTCTAPGGGQTCEADGAACAASGWTSAPRPLSACLTGLSTPTDRSPCAETPEWFGSYGANGYGPMVYVEKRRPTFKLGVRLDRVEAVEESGGDLWGDDEFESVLYASEVRSDGKILRRRLRYGNDFADGQIRHPEKLLEWSTASSSLLVWTQELIENDDGIGKFLDVIDGINQVAHVVAGVIVGGYYGGYAGATAGAAAGAGIAAGESRLIDAVFRDYADGDNLGSASWMGTVLDLFARASETRRADYLTSGTDVTLGPLRRSGDFEPYGKQEHRLGHPMRNNPPEDCQCGSGCSEQSCDSDEGCYANLCVDDFVSCAASDPFCNKSFREVRRFDTRSKSAEAEYQLDYLNTVELCNPTTGGCP